MRNNKYFLNIKWFKCRGNYQNISSICKTKLEELPYWETIQDVFENSRKNYPKYKFIVVGDTLYGTTPIINICKKNKWYYIFNLKTEKLKEVSSVIFKEKNK